jgi:integrase
MKRALANASALFDQQSMWEAEPLAAYLSWLRDAGPAPGPASPPKLCDGSAKVYGAMWASFVAFLAREGTDPTRATEDDLKRFIEGEKSDVGHQHRKRYARVLAQGLSRAKRNPQPRMALLRPEGRLDDRPTPFLSLAERSRLWSAIEERVDGESPAAVAARRAQALAALIAGAGLKPSQALAATSVNCAPSLDTGYWETPAGKRRAAPQLGAAMAAWLGRREVANTGPLFPGASGRPCDYARAFVGVKALLAKAEVGAGGERASPQTLRNTYAAWRIETGATLEELMICMGFAKLDSAARLKSAHSAWMRRMGL